MTQALAAVNDELSWPPHPLGLESYRVHKSPNESTTVITSAHRLSPDGVVVAYPLALPPQAQQAAAKVHDTVS